MHRLSNKVVPKVCSNEGKIIEREIPGMNTYTIATKFAIMLNEPEETKPVCVVESWKLYPNENEKTEKKDENMKQTDIFSTHLRS